MRAAGLTADVVDAKAASYLHELIETNPSAAASLAEGVDETLTVTIWA
jgi:hypothetical protein